MIGNETQNIATGAYTPTFDKEPKNPRPRIAEGLPGREYWFCLISFLWIERVGK